MVAPVPQVRLALQLRALHNCPHSATRSQVSVLASTRVTASHLQGTLPLPGKVAETGLQDAGSPTGTRHSKVEARC